MVDVSRRAFLLLAASGGAAVAADWSGKTAEKLIPYVIPPEDIRPGVWAIFPTTCRECPAGCGMHVRHMDGRAVKAEGNPDHPINHGALCARGQSSVQGLYDPDRVRHVLRGKGASRTRQEWDAALVEIADTLGKCRGRIVILSDLQTGALAEVMASFAKAFGGPESRPLFYEPFNYEPIRKAHEVLFDAPLIPDYRLGLCDFILSFGADFLETWISPVQYAQQFSRMHSYQDGRMGRMVYVGPRFSMTAANADEFLKVPPGAEQNVAVAVLETMIAEGWTRRDVSSVRSVIRNWAAKVGRPRGISEDRIKAIAKAFAQSEGSVALAGPVAATGPGVADTAVAALLLNYAAGRIGQTVDLSRAHALSQTASVQEMAQTLEALGKDDVLIVHNANPAFSLNGAAEYIARAGAVIYLGTMLDETAELADWVLPIDSPLESWGDYEPVRGVHGLMQPTTARLHKTRHAGDLLLAMAKGAGRPLTLPESSKPAGSFEEWLHHRWDKLRLATGSKASGADFWHEALRAGGVWQETEPTEVTLRKDLDAKALLDLSSSPPESASPASCALWTWPSIMLFDGRAANRGWMQEAPDPMTTITWGSWVEVNTLKAAALGLQNGDIVELSTKAGKLEAPVWITDDTDEGTVGIAFGQGHTALGRNAAGRGANAFRLLGDVSDGGNSALVTIRKTGRQAMPIVTTATQEQYGREIVQWVGLTELSRLKPGEGEKLTLPLPEGYDPKKDVYPPHDYPQHRWAMVIDLARCIGCGACAVACYAENNVAVVGPEHVLRRHQMAWLRIIPYRAEGDAGRLGFLPMLCQHCDAAPCEPVCPVFASVHNDEGLNAQVYNRCIGTRYCSNNCPYKVRRFNWINIEWPKPLDWQLNPDVTVRERGVMEKCTFCVQRIREVELKAKREGRGVKDGEVMPACAQTCPARAIVFGDLMDAKSEVADLTRRDPRRYHVLEELNTKSAITYLRRIDAEGEA